MKTATETLAANKLAATEALLRQSELRYRVLADHSPDWEYWLRPDGRFEYVSPACEAICGYPPQGFLDDPKLFCSLLHPDDRALWHEHLAEAIAGEHDTHDNLLLRLIDRDGQIKWLEHQCKSVHEQGAYLGRRGVNRDVTRRIQAEAEARHVSRLLKTLSEANQSIPRLREEAALAAEICRVAVEIGGLQASLVTMADIEPGRFMPYASAGLDGRLLGDLWLRLEGEELVLANGVRQRLHLPQVCGVAEPEALSAIWCKLRSDLGIGAAIHFPLLREGEVVGLISFFAESPEFLRQDVCDLLKELAGDLSYALDSFHHRRKEFESSYRLAQREAHLNTLLQTLPLGVGVVSSRVFSEVNPGVSKILGYTAEELLGHSSRMIYPDDAEFERVGREKYAELASRGTGRVETRWLRKDGRIVDVRLISSAFDADDLGKGVVFTAEDISQRKQAEAALESARQQLEMAIEAADLGIYDLDLRTGQITLNERYLSMLGYAPGELEFSRQVWLSMIHPDDLPAVSASLLEDPRRTLAGVEVEYRMRHKSGAWVWLLDRAKGFADAPDGEITHAVGVHIDLTARKQAEERLDFLSHYDTLTHLPNRELLRDRLEHALQRVRREGEKLAVLMLDLDRFKTINESLGHSVGDVLLKSVADRMLGQMRGGDTLARVGGDEFILLLENDVRPHSVDTVARKLLELFRQPIPVGDSNFSVTASIGISLFPDDADSVDDLLRNADAALYKAKSQGRDNYQFFEQQMTAGAFEHLLLENALRGAIKRDELRVHFQPQIDFVSGALRGVEALVRWQHPDLGLIAPGRFIPLAEEAGIIGAIGEWVLRESCRQMIVWDAAGLHVPCVAVNLSVRQIEDATLALMVAEALASTGLDGARLELEVTESMIMRDADQALKVLQELRTLGVRLAIDDFGTGYSSLSYLKRLPMNRLKIDQSFVRDIGLDSNGEAIVRAIIALGRSLGLETVAEGVELPSQADFLRFEACDVGQGYLYSRPVAADEITLLWSAGKLAAAARSSA